MRVFVIVTEMWLKNSLSHLCTVALSIQGKCELAWNGNTRYNSFPFWMILNISLGEGRGCAAVTKGCSIEIYGIGLKVNWETVSTGRWICLWLNCEVVECIRIFSKFCSVCSKSLNLFVQSVHWEWNCNLTRNLVVSVAFILPRNFEFFFLQRANEQAIISLKNSTPKPFTSREK